MLLGELLLDTLDVDDASLPLCVVPYAPVPVVSLVVVSVAPMSVVSLCEHPANPINTAANNANFFIFELLVSRFESGRFRLLRRRRRSFALKTSRFPRFPQWRKGRV
jgi:hypothetical protein